MMFPTEQPNSEFGRIANGSSGSSEAEPMHFRSMDLPLRMPAADPEPTPVIDLEAIERSAREEGLRAGMAHAEAQATAMLQQERQGIAAAVEEFVREKQRYFAGLEKEVVRLSLAIAERVLHRESAMDPTLLAGAARVALEQVDDDRGAVLRVPVDEVELWEMTMRSEGRNVEVRGDAALERGRCLLEAPAGTVELGVKPQLAEIEHGFFELLQRNPMAAAA